MKLSDFASNKYSQFGEDGMIQHIFSLIGWRLNFCVEFGAADGTSCSNTRNLWESGWNALLIEGDPNLFRHLEAVAGPFVNCQTVNTYLTPQGINSIDNILMERGVTDVDFMSIDVDGIDYQIWESMEIQPRVICIEYNQSIPPHISLHQESLSDNLGSSAKALEELAGRKGYKLIGLNKANLFFARAKESVAFRGYQCGLKDLFSFEDLSYVATDYRARPFIVGAPPWGLSETHYDGEVSGDPIHTIGRYLDLVGFQQSKTDPIVFIGQDWECSPSTETEVGAAAYRRVFSRGDSHIIIDVANQPDLGRCRWIEPIAKEYNYKLRILQRHLFLFTKEEK